MNGGILHAPRFSLSTYVFEKAIERNATQNDIKRLALGRDIGRLVAVSLVVP